MNLIPWDGATCGLLVSNVGGLAGRKLKCSFTSLEALPEAIGVSGLSKGWLLYVGEAMIREMEGRFGRPEVLRLTQVITPEEMALVRGSQKHGRAHDITLFIFQREKLALIRKPIHPPGVFRAPSGGLNPQEPFEEGAKREAREETGLEIEIERYLLRLQVRFICGEEGIEWSSHVFSARAVGEELAPQDTREIVATRWATLEELQGPIREAALAPGWGLLDYRVTLTDRAVALLQMERGCAPRKSRSGTILEEG